MKKELRKHCKKYEEVNSLELKFILVKNGTEEENFEDFDVVNYSDIVGKVYPDGTAEVDLRWFDEEYNTIMQITVNEDYSNTLILEVEERVAYDWGHIFCAEVKKEYGENICFWSNNIDFIEEYAIS